MYEQKSVACTATQSCVNAVITAITPTVSQLCGRYNLFLIRSIDIYIKLKLNLCNLNRINVF